MARMLFPSSKSQLAKLLVPSEVRLKYVNIIDDFLDDADLTTVSVKQARNAIQSKVQYDITPHKVSRFAICIRHALTLLVGYQRARPRALRCS